MSPKNVQLIWTKRSDHPTWKQLTAVSDCPCGAEASGGVSDGGRTHVDCPSRNERPRPHINWLQQEEVPQRFTITWQERSQQPHWLEDEDPRWRELLIEGPCRGCGLQLEVIWDKENSLWTLFKCPRCTTCNGLPSVNTHLLVTPDQTCPFCFFSTKLGGGPRSRAGGWLECRRCNEGLRVPPPTFS